MDCESSLKLPLIDFSNLELGSPKWEMAKALVKKALEEFGCFEASFEKVLLEARKGLFEALEELFNLPLETKLRNVSQKPFHGYVGQYPMAPLFESMGVEDSTMLEKVQTFTNILWPQGNPTFRCVHISICILSFFLFDIFSSIFFISRNRCLVAYVSGSL